MDFANFSRVRKLIVLRMHLQFAITWVRSKTEGWKFAYWLILVWSFRIFHHYLCLNYPFWANEESKWHLDFRKLLWSLFDPQLLPTLINLSSCLIPIFEVWLIVIFLLHLEGQESVIIHQNQGSEHGRNKNKTKIPPQACTDFTMSESCQLLEIFLSETCTIYPQTDKDSSLVHNSFMVR